MSDQQAPQNEDTPAVAGPEGGPGTAQEQTEIDWQRRYADLQPEYTRTTQQLRELEERERLYQDLVSGDPDTQRRAAEALGYELPEEEPEPVEHEDPWEELRARQERLEEQLSRRDQETLERENATIATSLTDSELESLGVDEADRDWIVRYALGSEPVYNPQVVDRYGQPIPLLNVKEAHEAWQARETERMKAWAKTKRAPHVPSGGQSATEVPDPGFGPQARFNRAMTSLQQSMGDDE